MENHVTKVSINDFHLYNSAILFMSNIFILYAGEHGLSGNVCPSYHIGTSTICFLFLSYSNVIQVKYFNVIRVKYRILPGIYAIT